MENSKKAYEEVCKILGIKPAKITENIAIPANTTLVIVPDQVFTRAKLYKLATEFGKKQPYETWICKDFYDQYSPEELCGKPTGAPYRYLLIPDEYNVPNGTVAEQKARGGRVPSVLEAIVFWFALREHGKTLNFDHTYIRHFDLEAKLLGGHLCVPRSCVDRGGEPVLYRSGAAGGVDARLAVGSNLNLALSPLPLELSKLTENTQALRELNETLKGIFKL